MQLLMKKEFMGAWVLILAISIFATPLCAEQRVEKIPMHSHGAQTFYIDSEIVGAGNFSMLVDTGSGYSVINEETLQQLLVGGQAEYISKLRGQMADGSERIIPLYKIAAITLGKNCIIYDVEAAVLPTNSRQIIGISTLMQAAPFSMSFQPPMLTLGQCNIVTSKQNDKNNSAPKVSISNLESESRIKNNQASAAGAGKT